MRTDHIILALTIAREKSISKAAEAMFISQPNASNMLKTLERELGYTLFERTGSGIVLTAEGAEFIDYAATIEQSLQAISQISSPMKHIDFRVLSMKSEFAELAFEKTCENCRFDQFTVNLHLQILPKAEEAVRMIECRRGDLAVIMCRKSLFELEVRHAASMHLETAFIGESHLEVTCKKDHPIIRDGRIRYDLFSEFPAFTSIASSDAENYIPAFPGSHDISVKNIFTMDAGDMRYRLLRKLNGYQISIPVPERYVADYDLESLAIEDSDVTFFALYRNDPHKKDLTNEFIRQCIDAFRDK